MRNLVNKNTHYTQQELIDKLFIPFFTEAHTVQSALYHKGKPSYQARESSLVPLCLLTVHFLQKT